MTELVFWVAITLLWGGLVSLTYAAAKRVSPTFLAKPDPETLLVIALFIGAVVVAFIYR
jgi:hypothetical protein